MDANKQAQVAGVHPYLQAALALEISAESGTFLFRLGQEVKHVKTGGIYIISGTPNQFVLEHSREPAYAYLMADGRTCVRGQSEMEDGRFESAAVGSSIAYHKGLEAAAALVGEKDLAPTSESIPVTSSITFNEFIEFGKAQAMHLVDGIPWSFIYKGHPVTHCDDDKYSLSTPVGGFILFHRGEMLHEVNGQLFVSKTTV